GLAERHLDTGVELGDFLVDQAVVGFEQTNLRNVVGAGSLLLLDALGGNHGVEARAPVAAMPLSVDVGGLVEVASTLDLFPSHFGFTYSIHLSTIYCQVSWLDDLGLSEQRG